MSELPEPDPKARSDEAIEWLVLLRSGRAGAAERRRFGEWRARSAQHARAFEDAERLFGLMREAAAGEWPAERGRSGRSVLAILWRPRVAAGLMAAILVATALHRLHLTDPLLSDYHTGTGEQRPIALADGSTLLLNTDTAVSILFGPTARRVRLLHGQALFTVAPDPNRRFEVEAGNVIVQSLGTVFEVYEQEGEVAVTVVDHAVAIGLAADLRRRTQRNVNTRASRRASTSATGRTPGSLRRKRSTCVRRAPGGGASSSSRMRPWNACSASWTATVPA